MADAGLDRIIRAEDVAHMGITEVIRHAPRVYTSYRRLVSSIKNAARTLAILIDFPDVNFRLARELKKAFNPGHLLRQPATLGLEAQSPPLGPPARQSHDGHLPLRGAFYRARGVDAEFVGHPLAELPPPTISREDYAVKAQPRPKENLDRSASRKPYGRNLQQFAIDG